LKRRAATLVADVVLTAPWDRAKNCRHRRFDEAVEAFGHLALGPFGKVVIKVAD
jgi:hypothetical protein